MMAASRGLQILGRGVPEVARTHLLSNKAWIAGQWVDAISGSTYPVYNPFNREIIAEVWRAELIVQPATSRETQTIEDYIYMRPYTCIMHCRSQTWPRMMFTGL